MAILLTAILCLIIGGGFAYLITYFYYREQISQTVEYNYKTEQQNKELEARNNKLLEEFDALDNTYRYKIEENNKLALTYAELSAKHEEILHSIERAEEQAQCSTEAIYKKTCEVMQNNIESAAIAMAQFYRDAEDDGKNEYLQEMEQCAEAFQSLIETKQTELLDLESKITTLASKVKAATAANVRQAEAENRKSFYSIGLSDADINEITKLRDVALYLRTARPMYKAIWEAYYRNPTTEMVNRVVGTGTHCGIYMITNMNDNKIYIGQSNQIGERFKNHIKCGLGIDAPSNKLYNAMQKEGVENFYFEVIEECKPSELNEREKYWIDFYQSNVYGYNMSSGGAKANQ